MRVDLKGKAGVLALVVVVLGVGLRVSTLGASNDPELRRAIQAELLSRLGGRIGEDLRGVSVDDMDSETVGRLLQRANVTGIEVHSMTVSRPVLRLSTSEEVVVLVEFSLPDAAPESEYWLFEHSAVAGWRYVRPTTVFSYYSNIL